MSRKTELLTTELEPMMEPMPYYQCSAEQDRERCTDDAKYLLIKGSRSSLLDDIITLAVIGDTLHRGFVPQGYMLCNAHMAQANNIVRTVNRIIEVGGAGANLRGQAEDWRETQGFGDRYETFQHDESKGEQA